MTYEVFLTKSALKDLKHVPMTIKKQFHNQIQRLENFPNVSNVIKLSGLPNKYRLRVGKYRILFELSGQKLIIFAILPRKKAYKQLK